jgi:hypothetical protein
MDIWFNEKWVNLKRKALRKEKSFGLPWVCSLERLFNSRCTWHYNE